MDDVKVTVEEPSAVTRRLTIEVPAAEVSRRYAETLKEYRRKAAMPGFRRGKVPPEMIRRLYAGDITADVARALISVSVDEALARFGFSPVSEPEYEILALEEGKPFGYSVRFEVRPAVELGDYAGLEVAGERVEVTEEELARLLEEIRESHATVRKVEEARGLREGDVAVIAFEGTVGGAPLPGGPGKDFPVVLGSNTFPPGFEDNLIGAVAGERREFTVRLPEKFSDPALAGREALFVVTVAEVRERVLPALDDEFAKDVGDYAGLEDLRARLRENLRRTKEAAARNRLREAVLSRLLEAHPVPVPPAMLERRREALAQDAERYLLLRGVPRAEVEKSRGSIREDAGAAAERKVRAALLLEAVAEREGLAVSEEELSAEIAKIAAANTLEPAEVRRRLVANGTLEGLRQSLREDKALDLVVARAKLSDQG